MVRTGSRSDGKNWGNDDLEGLPPTVNIYPWEGPDHFQNIVDSELHQFKDPQRSSPCDWIVFSNVSEPIFERDFEEETDLSKQWKSYNRSRQLLFVQIARGTPEQLYPEGSGRSDGTVDCFEVFLRHYDSRR
jgi:hypothetical protein